MNPDFAITRVHYPASTYRHPASGMLELRLVRNGSSHARIDLGAGPRGVFTRPGDLLFSLGDRPTVFAIEQGRELTLIQIPTPLAVRLLGEAGGTLAELSTLADRPLRDPLLAGLCRRLEGLPPEQAAMRGWALALALGLMLEAARARASRAQRPLLTASRLERVEARIEENLAGSVTVDELAALAGMPRRAFTSAFKEATGLPVYQFVMRRRAERATTLLQTTDLPLAGIAALVGFSHQAHMTRVLRGLTGRTPARVRAERG